jgi:hypothetical protein
MLKYIFDFFARAGFKNHFLKLVFSVLKSEFFEFKAFSKTWTLSFGTASDSKRLRYNKEIKSNLNVGLSIRIAYSD